MSLSPQFTVYKDRANEWRWTFSAANNRKIADSAEGYKNHSDCISAINIIKTSAAVAAIDDPQTLARLMSNRTILGGGFFSLK